MLKNKCHKCWLSFRNCKIFSQDLCCCQQQSKECYCWYRCLSLLQDAILSYNDTHRGLWTFGGLKDFLYTVQAHILINI